jgi:hypothetical protein
VVKSKLSFGKIGKKKTFDHSQGDKKEVRITTGKIREKFVEWQIFKCVYNYAYKMVGLTGYLVHG